MRKFVLQIATAIVFYFLSASMFAQDLQLQWAKAMDNSVSIADVVVDNQGNLYAVGSFSGTADFDLGPGTATLVTGTTFGNWGSFFVKYDVNGDYLFAHSLGDSGQVSVSNIVIDLLGNIWIGGSFNGTVDFDMAAGTANLIGTGALNLFLAKYDASGSYLQAFNINSPVDVRLEDLEVDVNNNILVVGHFEGTVDFDPTPGSFNLVSSGNNENLFLSKYTTSGSLVFAFKLETDYGAQAVAADVLGNIYLGVTFLGSIDMDPGSGNALFTSVGGSDGVWAKYDPNGNYLNGLSYDGGVNFLAVDHLNNLFISGRLPDSMDMDPGPGISMLYSENNFDIYFGKYDANGNYLHGRALESNVVHTQNGISTNHQSDLYIFGRMEDTANYNPGGTGGVLISEGSYDGYIAKYDASGSFDYAYSFGSTGSDDLRAMAVDLSGNVWLTGYFIDTIDVDFGPSTNNFTSPTTNSFIAKYKDLTVSGTEELASARKKVSIYGAENQVLIDFTDIDQVNAQVKVVNILGQTIAEAAHSRNDIVKIQLPNAAPQIYIVTVRNGESNYSEKVWVK